MNYNISGLVVTKYISESYSYIPLYPINFSGEVSSTYSSDSSVLVGMVDYSGEVTSKYSVSALFGLPLHVSGSVNSYHSVGLLNYQNFNIIGDVSSYNQVNSNIPVPYFMIMSGIYSFYSTTSKVKVVPAAFPYQTSNSFASVSLTNRNRGPYYKNSATVALKVETKLNNRVSYLGGKEVEVWSNLSGTWKKHNTYETDYEGYCFPLVQLPQVLADSCQFITLLTLENYKYISNFVRCDFIDN